jgi:hypothetical protein
MKITMLFLVIALAITGLVSAEDFIKTTGGMPVVKDLGNLSLDEISAIFSGGDSWFMSAGLSSYTPSQMSFLRDDASDGKPMGPGTGKMAYVGSSVPSN